MRSAKLACFNLILALISTSVIADEWNLHESSLKVTVIKIQDREKKIHELIQHKKRAKTKDEVEPILEDIKKNHKELGEIFKTYEREKEHVRFEHPDHGDKAERTYLRYKYRTIEQMEAEGGLDGKLTQVKKTMMGRYGIKPPPPKDAECVDLCQRGDVKPEPAKTAPSASPALVETIKLSK